MAIRLQTQRKLNPRKNRLRKAALAMVIHQEKAMALES
jgi:hypothetical protein